MLFIFASDSAFTSAVKVYTFFIQNDRRKKMIAVDLLSEIFILIVLGIYLKRNNVIDGHTVDQLTDLIVKIIIPCGIISTFEMKITHKILVTAGMVLIISIGIQVIYFILNSFFYTKNGIKMNK
mgnify:CR=1 FL=1